MDAMVGISKPVRDAFHVSGIEGSESDKERDPEEEEVEDDREEGSTSRSGILGCKIVRCAVRRSRMRRSTALASETDQASQPFSHRSGKDEERSTYLMLSRAMTTLHLPVSPLYFFPAISASSWQ